MNQTQQTIIDYGRELAALQEEYNYLQIGLNLMELLSLKVDLNFGANLTWRSTKIQCQQERNIFLGKLITVKHSYFINGQLETLLEMTQGQHVGYISIKTRELSLLNTARGLWCPII